ncbi:VgrG protein [Streptomyces sp. L-9-10]|uniref:hypothetical protein n=1 Tax=Streptomyces sp. L-9-10 TaxID=1478131 RepID=UPI0010D06BD0|nr:hypothetical protein [Streptomyces sp. L-9-10]RYJ29676.1 VgrG protein [Streptomyces sp. L-9-10]
MHGHGSRIAALAAATVLLLALGGGAATAVDRPTEPGQLTLINTAVGRVIADKLGNPLYMRTADEPDNPDCTGECADVWPAATGYPTKGRGVTNDTAQTVLNAENSDQPQVIYNTHPLYYYSNDKPHLPRGQHVDGFTLVSPNGSAMVLPLSAGPDPDPTVSGTTSSTSRAKPPATPTRTRAAAVPTRAPTRAPARTPTKAPTRAAPRTPTKAPTRAAPRPATKAPTRAATKAPAAPATRVPTPAARVTPARTAAPAVPRTTTGTSTAPSVGGLTITPSGAARGGADHMTAANPSGSYGAAELTLAIGATAAASAGTILVVRRFQRRSTGGQH